MAKGRKKAEPVDELDDDDDVEGQDSGDDAEDDFAPDLEDDDDDGDDEQSQTMVEVDLLLKAGASPAQSARRRVEDYLEMKRAARELSDLEDFDLD